MIHIDCNYTKKNRRTLSAIDDTTYHNRYRPHSKAMLLRVNKDEAIEDPFEDPRRGSSPAIMSRLYKIIIYFIIVTVFFILLKKIDELNGVSP
jgi:hypothetical protein